MSLPVQKNALIWSHIHSFCPTSAGPELSKASKAGFEPVIKAGWERLKGLSGSLIQQFVQEIEKSYQAKPADQAPSYYKLFSDLNNKIQQLRVYDPTEFLRIKAVMRRSLSEVRFLYIDKMVTAAFDTRAIWDRIAADVDRVAPHGIASNGPQRYLKIHLWFKSPANDDTRNRFTGFAFQSMNFGSIPRVLLQFHNLIALDLKNNKIRELPIEQMKTNLPNLECLDLRNNEMSLQEQFRANSELPKALPKLALCLMDNGAFESERGYNLRCMSPRIFQALGLPDVPHIKIFLWFASQTNQERLLEITELDLRGLNLRAIPDELFFCQNLVRLDLRENPELDAQAEKLVNIFGEELPKLDLVQFGNFTFNRKKEVAPPSPLAAPVAPSPVVTPIAPVVARPAPATPPTLPVIPTQAAEPAVLPRPRVGFMGPPPPVPPPHRRLCAIL